MHYILAAVVAVSAVLHVPSTLFPRIYFYINLGIFMVTSVYEGWFLLSRNGVIARSKGRKLPRVGEVFKYPDTNDNGPVQLTIVLQEALEMEAGQYVNIYTLQ
ncbi:MAG: hypothetical protein CL912_03715 [Deltaproteobacteria bacterium]|nr:hypothetical protein [Deltaproteobacteria bacterium]